MSEEANVEATKPRSDEATKGAGAAVSSPPAAPQPPRQAEDPRARLHELARELIRTRNRHVLVEYLRMRRASR